MISPLYILLAWAVTSPLLFVFLTPKRSVMASFTFGWLFLPKAGYSVAGLPDISPQVVIMMGVVIGISLFAKEAVFRIRPRTIDIFAVFLIVAPIGSSLANNLGLYDGVSNAFSNFAKWVFPYIMGRIMIRSLDDLRDFAIIILLGAFAYIPIALYEIRMSPTLNFYTYGFRPFQFSTTKRLGGWRPVGFMTHGIELGMWFMVAAWLSATLWFSRRKAAIGGVPMWFVAISLLVMLVLSRAIGAWILCAVIFGVFAILRVIRFKPILLAFVLIPAIYAGVRVTNTWNGLGLVAAFEVISEKRAASLETRLLHEQKLNERAMERPVFGWGGWGRNRIRNWAGKDLSLTDGMWIIILGQQGLMGLIGWLGLWIAPCVVAVRRASIGVLASRDFRLMYVFILLVPAIMIDLMFNAFVGPSLIMIPGGLVALTPLLCSRTKGTKSYAGPRRDSHLPGSRHL